MALDTEKRPDFSLFQDIHQLPVKDGQFVIDLRVYGGSRLGEDMYEVYSYTRLDSQRQTILKEMGGSRYGGKGSPIGVFIKSEDKTFFDNIDAMVNQLGVFNLAKGRGGGFSATIYEITRKKQDSIEQYVVTSMDHEIQDKIAPLFDAITGKNIEVRKYPVYAVSSSVEYKKSANSFNLILHNIGANRICVSNPTDDENTLAEIRIAEQPAGSAATQLTWISIPVKSINQKAKDNVLMIEPNQEVTFTSSQWQGDGTKKYYVQGVYKNYKGPRWIGDCYNVRGIAYSEIMELEKF